MSQAYYPIKGLHILISALPLIKKRFPEVMVFVAGKRDFVDDTPYGKYIKKLLKKEHMADSVVFTGCLTEEKVKQRLLRTHVMVMPSLLENSPNSIGEAMLLGTPVIAADVGGIASIVEDEIEGSLYPALNRRALASRICRLFEHDDLALRFSCNGKKRARTLYCQRQNAEQLLDIYDDMMGGR